MSRAKDRTSEYLERLLPKVINSEEKEVEFDPKFIFQSLLAETELEESIAIKVTEEITRRLIGSATKTLTSPMIRELLCSLLVEKGLEQARYHYTRLGIPYKDVENLLEPLGKVEKGVPFEEIERLLIKESIAKKVCSQVYREFEGINRIVKSLVQQKNE